jgi:hypothetical protein
MRSDYLPATAVCFCCGSLIRESQINGCVEGLITHTKEDGTILIDPFTGYLCSECKHKTKGYIEGGIPAAKERARRWTDEDKRLGE